jgi:hypothetical protein
MKLRRGSVEDQTFWTGANAITNIAYPKEVKRTEVEWKWFNTGIEIPNDYKGWHTDHPQAEYYEKYQSYEGCAVFSAHSGNLHSWICQMPNPSLCEVVTSV